MCTHVYARVLHICHAKMYARGMCVAAYVNVSLQEKKKCGDSLDNTDAPNERERSAEP